jgi:hypothetical protein
MKPEASEESIATVTARIQATTRVSPSARPPARAMRGTGSDRRRSKNPWSTSSATPTAIPVPMIRAVVSTKPGTRKSTYATGPKSMAPPKMYRKSTRKMATFTMLKTRSWGVRTYLRRVRFATVATVASTPADLALGTIALEGVTESVVDVVTVILSPRGGLRGWACGVLSRGRRRLESPPRSG